MSRNEVIVFAVSLVIFAIVIASLICVDWIDIAQAIELTILFALVCVTTIYAKRTAEISSATKEQTKEVREQRYTECLPLLVPDITRRGVIDQNLEPNEVYYQTLQTGVGIEVIWHNLGKGVAINTQFSFWTDVSLDSHPGKALYFPPLESEALEIGGQKEIKFHEAWGGQLYDIS